MLCISLHTLRTTRTPTRRDNGHHYKYSTVHTHAPHYSYPVVETLPSSLICDELIVQRLL